MTCLRHGWAIGDNALARGCRAANEGHGIRDCECDVKSLAARSARDRRRHPPSQLLVLREIDTGEAVTPGLIARRLQFSHATITAIVDRLVALDLASRSRSDQDKRRVLLEATAKGRRCLAEAPDMLQEIFADRFAALPAWEQAMLLAGTERLADLLGAGDMDAAPLLDAGAIDRA